jgi:chorismate synthase
MASVFGNILKVSTFGESHGVGLGAVLEGVPAGIPLDEEIIQRDLDRRKPGTSRFVTQRKESDTVKLLSGVFEGRTIGTSLGMVIYNQDAKSKDYKAINQLFRPGHADYTYFEKYGVTPLPGGGRASGRETAARVAAGAVARAILKPLGVALYAYTIRIGSVRAETIDPEFAEDHPLRCADPSKARAMEAEVDAARTQKDSVGGLLELVVKGVPAGWGDPVFNKLDAMLGGALFSIGAVKGIEIGAGFEVVQRRGSQNNDQMEAGGFASNHAGGILGGISSGQDIVIRLAIKPTPSIAQVQQTRNLAGEAAQIEIKGRHDPCVCPRIAPVAEAMAALVLADAYLMQRALKGS